MSGLFRLFKLLAIYSEIITRDIFEPYDVPLNERFRLWRKGFSCNKYYIYNLQQNSTKDYVSDVFRELTHPKNGTFSQILDNKFYLPYLLHRFPDCVPLYFFLKYKGFNIDCVGNQKIIDDDVFFFKLESLLKQRYKLIAKPICDTFGNGVLLLELRDNTFYINKRKYLINDFKRKMNLLNSYVITEFVENHHYAVDIFPDTTNTIRVFTMWDDELHQPFIAKCWHRFGIKKTIPVDNSEAGGIGSMVDIETGKLGTVYFRTSDWRLLLFDNHIDTSVAITGVVVPHWDVVCRSILQMATELAFVPYLGWDVVVTENGFKILEINSNSGVTSMQNDKGLLTDERVKKFYCRFKTRLSSPFFNR